MSDAPSILVVDDDRDIRTLVSGLLKENGYRATVVENGRGLMKMLKAGRFDLIVLDLMLPDGDGLSLCRQLRATSNIPVIIVSARGDDLDRILGLEIGADDYLAKPFHPRELLARIRSVLRRLNALPDHPADAPPGTAIPFAGWRLDPGARTATNPDGVLVHLTAGEFDILRALAERPGRLLSRDQLTALLRGPHADMLSRSVDIHISRLRRKVEPDPRTPRLIITVRNEGYMLNAGDGPDPGAPP